MSGESGQWTVDINDDNTGVVLEFSHVGDTGVEAFTTAMPREHALTFAAAVLNLALELDCDSD